jgi:glycine cleavage system transcriptional repressor
MNMRTQLLITSIGEDRPGIVARLTEIFVDHGANLEESRMAILGGEFAAIMLVSSPTDNIPQLEVDLSSLHKEGIAVTCRKTEHLDPARFQHYGSFEISLKGADHEGIVHRVSSFLHDQAINIQSVETTVVNAPVSGTPLFQMKALLLVPPAVKTSDLQKNLNDIAAQELVDIDLKPVKKS